MTPFETSAAAAVVDGRGARRARRGHPWIYQDDIAKLAAEPGDLVRVVDRHAVFCCWAIASPASKISLRRVSRVETPPDRAFWTERLRSALARRGTRARAGEGCARLLHAEADGFPGLTVDRYGEHLVLQATTVWADRVQGELAQELLSETGCTTALARSDARGRELEGLPLTVTPLIGEPPVVLDVEEGGALRRVDIYRGHKTGLYLDQQDNHRAACGWLQGRVLDLFCGEGGFALPLALAGCRVIAVDQSRPGLERADAASERNGVSAGIEWIEGDVFDFLADAESNRTTVDAVVLDPPPFARRRAELEGGLRGYRDLHRRALKLLPIGGRMLSFSCSFHASPADFESTVRDAAEEAACSAVILARPGPAEDHPELLELPESRYLKGVLIEKRAG
ncbi:MAG: class I SAM-dependent rRNA methyltransferase [Acidobacteriota bacterium]